MKLGAHVPATASLDVGSLAYHQTPTDLHDEGHFHYFTFRSLRRICLERAGFKHVEELGYGRTTLSRYPRTAIGGVSRGYALMDVKRLVESSTNRALCLHLA